MGYTGFAGFEGELRKVRLRTEAGFGPTSVASGTAMCAEVGTNSGTKVSESAFAGRTGSHSLQLVGAAAHDARCPSPLVASSVLAYGQARA
jgi:hypothetical protein